MGLSSVVLQLLARWSYMTRGITESASPSTFPLPPILNSVEISLFGVELQEPLGQVHISSV